MDTEHFLNPKRKSTFNSYSTELSQSVILGNRLSNQARAAELAAHALFGKIFQLGLLVFILISVDRVIIWSSNNHGKRALVISSYSLEY